jgi:PST family polysaccharide transporter
MPSPNSGAPSPDAAFATEELLGDIGRRSRRGGALLLSAQVVRLVGQVVTIVVLARLLPPSAFGLLAMVAAIGIVLDLVKEFGLSAATIQKQDISHAQVSALFWVNASVGLLLAAGLFAAAPWLADFYAQPELEAIASWLAIGFAASGFTVQHWALMRRQMRFGAIAGIETAADYVGFAAAIALASLGAGYWALVAQRVLSPVLLMLGSWAVCRWRPSRPGPTDGLRELIAYGAGVTGSGLAAAFSRSIDQILIGWMWGATVLGLYERTTRLLMLPVNTINAPVYAAAMPALSRLLDHPDRYRSLFCQVMQKLALLTMPPFALVAVTADWVVEIVLGPAWVEAVPLVALFSVAATCLPLVMAAGLLYMTQARTGEMLRATLVDAAFCVAAILGGLHWGVVGIAAMLALAGPGLRLPAAIWLATRRGPVSAAQTWRAIAPPASAAIAVMLAVASCRSIVITATPVTLASVAVFALAVTVVVLFAWPETRHDLVAVMRPRRRRHRLM